MKTIHKILFLSIFMLIALGSSNNLLSQDVDCDPCPSESWITAFTYTIIGGCPVEIEYQYKSCTDKQLSLRLVSVNYDNTSCSIGLSVLMDKATEEIMFDIKKLKLMFGTPGDLDIMMALPQCLENTGSGSTDKFTACTPTFYCCKEFTTNWRADSIKSIDVSSSYSDNCGILGGSCDYSCETIDDISTGPIPYNPEGICGNTCNKSFDGKRIEYVNSSCTISINYLHRTNCDNENEIILEYVVTNGSCSSYSSSDSIIKRAVNEILKAEAPSSSSFTFKVNSCWSSESFGSKTAWQRCVPSGCCEAEYFVTYSDPDTEIDSYTRTVNPPDACVMSCTYLCDDDHLEPLADLDGVLLKPTFNIDSRTLTTFNKVIPNPTSTTTNFVLESPDEGQIKLSIYDNLGVLVLNYTFEKLSYHKETTLDLNNLSNGTYHFNYESQGSIISSGSFIVYK